MTGEQLKKSIIQMAIQGKLVAQRENEEPASILLEKIIEEKKNLIKQGKIKKGKELTPITDEEKPFDIPESWEWVRLGDIAYCFNGNSINANVKKTKFSTVNEGYNYIGTKDVRFDYTIDYNNGIKIPYELRKYKIAPKGSVLICIEGGSAGRKIGVLNQDVCFGNKLCSINSILINEKLIYYYLQSSAFTKDFSEKTTGIIGGVSIEKLKLLYLPLPPLEEQKRIVEKLEKILPLVEEYGKYEQEMTNLDKSIQDKLKKSVLQHAIQGKLVEKIDLEEKASVLLEKIKEEKRLLIKQGKIKKEKELPPITEEEKPFDIPENWEWVRLGDIIELTKNLNVIKKYSKEDSIYYLDIDSIDNIKHSIKDMKLVKIKNLSTRAQRVLEKGQICFSLVRPYLNNIAFINFDKDKLMIGTTGLAVFKTYVNDNYVFYYLLSPYIKYLYLSMLTGFNSPSIGITKFCLTVISLPPLNEQSRIVAKTEEIFEIIDNMFKSKEILRVIKVGQIPLREEQERFLEAAQGNVEGIAELLDE